MAVTVNQAELMAKARRHLKYGAVEHLYGGQWKVTSGDSGMFYAVREMVKDGKPGASCSCPWGGFREWGDIRSACSHVRAVFIWIHQNGHPLDQEHHRFVERVLGTPYIERVLSAWGSMEDAKRQHRPILDIGDGAILTSRKKDWGKAGA
jgi:hypothetical protein